MNKVKIISNSIILITIMFCGSLYAQNKNRDKCQINKFESLFIKEFQLSDISEHMDQFGSSLYKSMS